MKKTRLIFAALTLLLGSQAFSQDFKPAAGGKNLEVQFAPLSSTPIGVPGIRYRHFLSPTLAARTTLFAEYLRDPEITQQADPDDDLKELRDIETDYRFSLDIGIEKHFMGTDRLSPYLGTELGLGIRGTFDRDEYQSTDNEIYARNRVSRNLTTTLNALAGVDFYLSPKLYTGIEFGYGVVWNGPQVAKISFDDPSRMLESTGRQPGSLYFGIVNSLARLRLGYFF